MSLCYLPTLIEELWQHTTDITVFSSVSSPGLITTLTVVSCPWLVLGQLGALVEMVTHLCLQNIKQTGTECPWMKIFTMYNLAVSGRSSLSNKNRLNAHTKNLNTPSPLSPSPLSPSPVGHMWTFPTFRLESLCLAPFCCDQNVLQASCWNGFCMLLDQTLQFFDQ